MFICGFDGFAHKTAAGAPAQGVVAGMARGRRVDDGATGGMSADILLAHCIRGSEGAPAISTIRSAGPNAAGCAIQSTSVVQLAILAAVRRRDCRFACRPRPRSAVTSVTVRDIRRAANRPHMNLSPKPGEGPLVKRTELGRVFSRPNGQPRRLRLTPPGFRGPPGLRREDL